MRITYLTRVDLQRKIPYDPDFHGIVETKFDVSLNAAKSAEPDLLIRIDLTVRYVIRNERREMGRIVTRANCRITGMNVPRTPDGSVDVGKTSEEFKMVVEGAVAEDILLPLAALARAARLPGFVPRPTLFPRTDRVPGRPHPPAVGTDQSQPRSRPRRQKSRRIK